MLRHSQNLQYYYEMLRFTKPGLTIRYMICTGKLTGKLPV